EYFYAIYDGETRLTPADGSYHLQTHPEIGSDRDVYFWAVGDSGTGGKAQANVHQAMIEHNRKIGRELDLYLHVGDMAYGSGTDTELSGRFFAMYEPTLRNLPCWPAMGNHEGKTSSGKSGIGPFYDCYICPTDAESGGLPSGNESYYSFDYGKVHFIALNSHDLDRSPAGAMAQWLKADLEQTKADWIVCFFHHPPYTKGTHDSDREGQLIEMREHIMPILESGGCDLTLTGHSHIYERSMLVDGAYATPTVAEGVIIDDGDGDPDGDGAYKKTSGLNPNNGSINIVTGHGGTGVGRRGTSPIMRKVIVENGSTLIHIKGDTLHGTMVNYQGDVRDTFAIVKSADVPIERETIENPWQPAEKEATAKKQKNDKDQKMPKRFVTLLPPNATWSYLAGEHPPGDWAQPDFDGSEWKTGQAGFGYGDRDDKTVLDDMRKNYKVIYIRRELEIPEGTNANDIGLAISYDDAFIAYLNGKEIMRSGVDFGSGKSAKGFQPHEANRQFEFFPFEGKQTLIRAGTNVLAIEGHNANLDSSDLTLHPTIIVRQPAKK
ncbi:MAG: metallophosphoesterase, partial [Verrucomicrobiales bacterium]